MVFRELCGTYLSNDIPRWSCRRYQIRLCPRRGISRIRHNILFCSLYTSFFRYIFVRYLVQLVAVATIVLAAYRQPLAIFGYHFCTFSVGIAHFAFISKRLSATVADNVVVCHFLNHSSPPIVLCDFQLPNKAICKEHFL